MEYPFRASVVIYHNVTVVIDAAGLSEVQVDGGVLVVEVVEIALVQAAPDVVAEDGNLHGGGGLFKQNEGFQPDVVVDDKDAFLGGLVDSRIGDVGFNRFAVQNQVFAARIGVGEIVYHLGQVRFGHHIGFDFGDVGRVLCGLHRQL